MIELQPIGSLRSSVSEKTHLHELLVNLVDLPQELLKQLVAFPAPLGFNNLELELLSWAVGEIGATKALSAAVGSVRWTRQKKRW